MPPTRPPHAASPPLVPTQDPPRPADEPAIRLVLDDLPPKGSNFSAADRQEHIALYLHALNRVYGRNTESPPNGAGWPLASPRFVPSISPDAPKLYVIKENGQAYCDGVAMAFKDLPATCVLYDKRVLARADDKFVWESILWTDTGATPPDYPQPPGVQILPKEPGLKLRAVAADGDDGGAFT